MCPAAYLFLSPRFSRATNHHSLLTDYPEHTLIQKLGNSLKINAKKISTRTESRCSALCTSHNSRIMNHAALLTNLPRRQAGHQLLITTHGAMRNAPEASM